MKAVMCHQYGPPEVLRIEEIEKPAPAPGDALVKVRAVTVTSGDCRMRAFDVPPMFWLPGRLALGFRGPKQPIPGMVLAGEVESVGRDVTRLQPGDEIMTFATQGLGTYAEYVALPEDAPFGRKPAGISWEVAAGIPFGGITALWFLRQGDIQPGDEVLINGASGAVGTFAVQLAKRFGAEVTAVCGPANADLVRDLGADRVIDYTREDFTQNGKKYDILFDAVGKRTFAECKDSLKDDGVLLHSVMVLAGLKSAWWARTTGTKVVGGTAVPTSEDMDFLAALVADGELRVVIDRTYPLDEIVEAHRYVDTGHKKGVVAVSIA